MIDPLELIDVYGADAVRFWCARAVSFGQDGNASVEDVHERYERELGNDLGNLLSRTTAMIARYRDGRLEPRRGLAGAGGGARRAGPRRCPARFDAWDLPARSRRSGRSSAGSTTTSRRPSPWELAKDEARSASELDEVLYDLADGLRAVAVALSVVSPGDARRGSSRRSDSRTTSRWENVAHGPRRSQPRASQPAQPLFPRIDSPRRGVIDTHAHLDACADRPRRSSRARARPESTGSSPSARASSRAARRSRSPSGTRASSRRSASTRTRRPTTRRTRIGELRELLDHERVVAVGETGLDYFRDYAPRDAQRTLFEPSSRSRPSSASRS